MAALIQASCFFFMYCLTKSSSRSLPRFDVFNTTLEAAVAQRSYVHCYIPHLSVYSLRLLRLDASLLMSSVTYFFISLLTNLMTLSGEAACFSYSVIVQSLLF